MAAGLESARGVADGVVSGRAVAFAPADEMADGDADVVAVGFGIGRGVDLASGEGVRVGAGVGFGVGRGVDGTVGAGLPGGGSLSAGGVEPSEEVELEGAAGVLCATTMGVSEGAGWVIMDEPG